MTAIKNRFCEITCGVVNVFLSSDGQSIPFGSNWVHKIDEGLNAAKIIFIFITPNSILSNWIYFEAGYAYSKGINVIPVGLGVDITLLKPPLHLLQGFNLHSCDSLNNIIAITNDKFSTNFPENFTARDYSQISNHFGAKKIVNPENLYSSINFEICSEKINDDNQNMLVCKYFDVMTNYLTSNGIPFSSQTERGTRDVQFCGIRTYIGEFYNNVVKIDVSMSSFNLESSLGIINSWLTQCSKLECIKIRFRLNKKARIRDDPYAISAIIYNRLDLFSIDEETIDQYKYKTLVFHMNEFNIGITYIINVSNTSEILELLNILYEIDIIQTFRKVDKLSSYKL